MKTVLFYAPQVHIAKAAGFYIAFERQRKHIAPSLLGISPFLPNRIKSEEMAAYLHKVRGIDITVLVYICGSLLIRGNSIKI